MQKYKMSFWDQHYKVKL